MVRFVHENENPKRTVIFDGIEHQVYEDEEKERVQSIQ